MAALEVGDSLRKLSEARPGDSLEVSTGYSNFSGTVMKSPKGELFLVKEKRAMLIRDADGSNPSNLSLIWGLRGKLPAVVSAADSEEDEVPSTAGDDAELSGYSGLIKTSRNSASVIRKYGSEVVSGLEVEVANIIEELANALEKQQGEYDKLLTLYAEGVAERAELQAKLKAATGS